MKEKNITSLHEVLVNFLKVKEEIEEIMGKYTTDPIDDEDVFEIFVKVEEFVTTFFNTDSNIRSLFRNLIK